ncbi:MAG: serine/threonine protein kinase [Solumvirus sp.]|uniref:Serine/threonine protein kinase n=1 Tax=Solumvirus sp. TaxID=2487773 RepID=A0A3G5AG52_9VIRU|nr:MAG: serine/threonine protein kinase [Solumvirus sp.]
MLTKKDTCGTGAYSRVYTVEDDRGAQFALKRNFADIDSNFWNNSREFEVLNIFRGHPHIIELKGVAFANQFKSPLSPKGSGDRDDMVHFVFDKAQCDLQHFIEKKTNITADSFTSMCLQMCAAVDFMHFNTIAHRDIKLSNFLIYLKDGLPSIRICDFGFAKPMTASAPSSPRVSTCVYRAPEICLDGNHSYAVDVWSLGCAIFELATRKQFNSVNNEEGVPLLEGIIKRMPDVSPSEWGSLPISAQRMLQATSRSAPLNLRWQSELKSSYIKGLDIVKLTSLLEGMLTFNPLKRMKIGEVLGHEFFGKVHQDYLKHLRSTYGLNFVRNVKIASTKCFERQRAFEIIEDLYSRRKCQIYTDRILFQAISFYDRYISIAILEDSTHTETPTRGKLLDSREAGLRFASCYYMAVKYFTTVHKQESFARIVKFLLPDEVLSDTDYTIISKFECDLYDKYLKSNIYYDTIYEAFSIKYNKAPESDDVHAMLLFLKTFDGSANSTELIDKFDLVKNSINGVIVNHVSSIKIDVSNSDIGTKDNKKDQKFNELNNVFGGVFKDPFSNISFAATQLRENPFSSVNNPFATSVKTEPVKDDLKIQELKKK